MYGILNYFEIIIEKVLQEGFDDCPKDIIIINDCLAILRMRLFQHVKIRFWLTPGLLALSNIGLGTQITR